MSLNNFQKSFSDFFLTGEQDYALQSQLKRYPRDILDTRLNIHRNNFYASLGENLRETFSTVNALVGEAFFTALASAYITQHPPQKAAMIWLGDSFPSFIAEFEHTQNIVYLADIARLNWYQHLAYHAEEAKPLTPEYFNSLSNHTLTNSTFCFHPSVAILQSSYAVYSIWHSSINLNTLQQNPPKKDTPNIHADTAESVLIVRPDVEVSTYNLSPALAVFLNALRNKQTLLQAATQAADFAEAKTLDFNPSEAVAFLISSGITISGTLTSTSEEDD